MKPCLPLLAAMTLTMMWTTVRGFQSHPSRGVPISITTRLFAKSKTIVRQGDFWQAPMETVWRPTLDDVERISWGKPAKRKGTGSRGVPHRLNEEERILFDRARQKGFLEVAGSAWRSQRREAPLLNTHRSMCDARGQASIVLHKGNTGVDDVVVDLSPLRNPEMFDAIAKVCLEQQIGGQVVAQGITSGTTSDDDNDDPVVVDDPVDVDNPWENRPIYQLPPYCITWELPRAEAKDLGKKMSELFDTAEGKIASSRKPMVKAGKSRRHGGYGIG